MKALISSVLVVGLWSAAAVAQEVTPLPELAEGLTLALRGAGASSPSFLGVGVAEITSARARELKLNEERGVEITRVEDDSPASKAGIKTGDVVLEFNGQRVEGMEQFVRLVREIPAGREAKLLVNRNGSAQTITAIVGSRKMGPVVMGQSFGGLQPGWPRGLDIPMPDLPRIVTAWNSSRLGIEAESVGQQLGEFFGVKEGVLVRSVAKGSAAERAGIHAGDVLTRIDQTTVASPAAVTAALRASRPRQSFPVTVVRNKQETSVIVTIDEAGVAEPPTPPKVILRGRSVKM